MVSDRELYRLFRQETGRLFEELVLRYRHPLVYFIMGFTRDYAHAEDLAQDVFASLYRKPEQYQDTYPFKSFLYLLGKRRAIDFLRRERRHLVLDESIPEEELADRESLEDQIFRREAARNLQKALGALPESYRQVLVLTQLEDLSMAEAGRVLGKSEAGTKVLAHRARKKLAKVLLDMGEGEEER